MTTQNQGQNEDSAHGEPLEPIPESAHGEPLAPLIESPDGTLLFPDGTEGRRGRLTESQQRWMDVFEALRRFGQTGDDSELFRLGVFTDDGEDAET